LNEEPKPNFNAADPKQVETRKRKEDRELQRRENAERFVMGDARGRLFVWWILSECGMFRQSFTGNSETFFLEGKRSIGLKLTAELEQKTPKEFLQMWTEHLAEKEKAAKEDGAARINGAAKEGDSKNEEV
jgi:hypothetical protein